MAGTLIHEYVHALLHVGTNDDIDRLRCELEAEAVAYIVGHQYGLDMESSTFHLPPWEPDDVGVILDLLNRISRTTTTFIKALDSCLSRQQHSTEYK